MRTRFGWRWCRRHPKATGLGAAVIAVLVLAGTLGDPRQNSTGTDQSTAAGPAPSASSTALPASTRTAKSSGTAAAVLATLPIKGRAAKTGYDRARFGSAWTDDTDDLLGHNGCDTRNDILRRDLSSVVLKADSRGCAVLTGVLRDPYTATTIRFRRGGSTSDAVQIDHVVPLGDAWQTGASRWNDRTRTDLANDPLNLLAVDGSINEAKGDGDAATWLPPNTAYRCAYVARQIAVKARYRLWITRSEHDALSRVLSTCPAQDAPTEPGSAVVELAPRSTAPSSAPVGTTPRDVAYADYAAVRAAGAAPIHRGDPGYSAQLDRDGDGVACE